MTDRNKGHYSNRMTAKASIEVKCSIQNASMSVSTKGQVMLSCSALAVKEDAVQTECKLNSDKHDAQIAMLFQSACSSQS
jgi:hypothetical protein